MQIFVTLHQKISTPLPLKTFFGLHSCTPLPGNSNLVVLENLLSLGTSHDLSWGLQCMVFHGTTQLCANCLCLHFQPTKATVLYWKTKQPGTYSLQSGFPTFYDCTVSDGRHLYAIPSFEYPDMVKVSSDMYKFLQLILMLFSTLCEENLITGHSLMDLHHGLHILKS